MGANRKLQQEIDRTLKKVQEGIEVFDQIWEKVRGRPAFSRDGMKRNVKACPIAFSGMLV